MTRTPAAVRLLALLALILTLAFTPAAPAIARPPAADQPCGPQATRVPGKGTPDNRPSIPVLFVHGINSSSAVWEGDDALHTPVNESLAWQAASIPGVSSWLFDYRSAALQWVGDQRIGPALAGAITCLRQATGHRVVLVAHSMGGLASQYAAATDATAASDIDRVYTIGTPFNGSLLLSLAQASVHGLAATLPPPVFAGIEAVLSWCAGTTQRAQAKNGASPCDSTLAVADSPIGQALEYGSAAVRTLKPWPPTVQIVSMDGEIRTHLWLQPLGPAVVGDAVVTPDSALGPHGGSLISHRTVSCENALRDLLSSSCFHNALPGNQTIRSHVLTELRALAERTSLAPYVGTWHAHGATLTLNPNGAGSYTWNAGPCQAALSTPEPLCTGRAQLRLTPRQDGRATVTFTTVVYTQADGSPAPPTFTPPPDSPNSGRATGSLTTGPAPGVLESPALGNPYLCSSAASPAWITRCN